jgi:hypothetical protein
MTAFLFTYDKAKAISEVDLQKGIFELFRIAGEIEQENMSCKDKDSGIPR